MTSTIFAVFFSTPLAALATAGAAAAVPVVIHLLNRRRYQVVDWAAMRFLQAALKRNVRRMRLEHWLLLLVRCCVVLLPALAMAAAMPWAEPAWERVFPGAASSPRIVGRTHHVIVLDASLSMSAVRDDGSAFEGAQRMAIEHVRRLPGGDGVSVVTLGAPPKAIIPGPADDPGRIAREIEELRGAHGGADLSAGLAQVEDLLSRSPGKFARRVVYLFTDMQRSQWAAPPTPTGTWVESWQRLHDRADVALVDVGAGPSGNIAINSLTLVDSLLTAGSRSSLTAVVQNYSPRERKQVRVELWQSKTAAVGRVAAGDAPYLPRVLRQELLDLPAGGSATLSFPVEFRVAGDYLFEARVEPDGLAADDRRALPVNVRDSLPVLLVNGQPSADRFETATGWLAAALDPFPAGPRPPGYPARPKVIDEARFGDPDLDLNAFDCVYLCDIARPTARDRDRLEAYLRLGGTVVLALGPRTDPEAYNRHFFRNGDGLLPAKLLSRGRAEGETFFTLTADDESFRKPPLSAFAGDDDRAAVLAARFREYWRIEPSPKSPARRLLSFLPPAPTGDGLLYEWSRGRGRVVLITSTVNTEWTGWPVAPSFPPFVQELLRWSARQPARRVLTVGEPIDEFVSEGGGATEAMVAPPDGPAVNVPLVAGDDGLRLHFTDTDRAGIYTVTIPGLPPRAFAVNVAPGGEGDLARVVPGDLPPTGPDTEAQVVTSPEKVRYRALTGQVAAPPSEEGGALGAAVALWLLLAALALLLVEPLLAWRLGSARNPATAIDRPASTAGRRLMDRAFALLAALPLLLIAAGGFVLLHAAATGELFGFLPGEWRRALEAAIGVPPAAAGEGTRWRFERLPVFNGDPVADRWLISAVALAGIALVAFVYFHELRRASRVAGVPLVALRFGLVLVALFVLLPQLRLVFEREGWPDLAVLIDDSQSMGVTDDYPDPAMKRAVSSLTPGGRAPTRLQIAQALLTQSGDPWLARLVGERQTRLHVFRMSDRLERVAEIADESGVPAAARAVAGLQASGTASRLGDAVHGVLQEFRGSSLAGVIILTDGITTEGDDLAQAGKQAARAGVPLTLVGIGDAREPRDLAVSDLRVDDVVHVGDRLVFEAKLHSRGGLSGLVPVTLFERQGDRLVELARVDVVVDSTGPAKVRLVHSPREPGERQYVLEVPSQPGEADTTNNRLARTVLVSEFRRTRVLLIDSQPRYDFRAVKTMLERETAAVRGNKSVELKVLLLDADPDYARQDRSALEAFPASRDELFAQFDVVVLGDVDPRHPELGDNRLTWLAEFVRERGGGLLFESGANHPPAVWRDTPLASVLPVEPAGAGPESTVRPTGYRPSLTPIGRSHPVLRFASDEAENIDIWSKFKPFFWAATGIKPKPAAEVLAAMPDDGPSAGTPLVVQQFVGAGRVLFLGFDETWRWRYRADEARFNQFWLQAVRYLARTRTGRPEIRLDRQTPYRRGEPIRVTVRYPEDKPLPHPDAPVRVALERTPPGGAAERQTLQLAAVAGSRATFETIVTRTPDGEYAFDLLGVDGGTPPRAEARVLPPPGEMDRLRMNRADLERAAQASRGRFYTLADASRLPADLPPLPRVTLHQPRPPLPIWNAPVVFLLALSLAGAEWTLRKRQRLL